MTAAHRALPFGTLVRVTDLLSLQAVLVRINDRGPYVASRIIDLSRSAAEALDLIARGVGEVSLEVLRPGIDTNNDSISTVLSQSADSFEPTKKFEGAPEVNPGAPS